MPLPTPKKGEKKDDFIDRCMANPTMREDFPDSSQRRAVCEKQSERRNNEQHSVDRPSDEPQYRTDKGGKDPTDSMFYFKVYAEKPQIRSFRGVEHTVIPVVALVEGVLQASNSPRPELVTESEIKKTVSGWNGRPVVVDHPEKRGQPVSANSPDVLETEQIGIIFNSVATDRKLKCEAWINPEIDSDDERITNVVDRLNKGEIVEVSTGFFADTTESVGKFNEEPYQGILSNIVPDHLAILSSAKGACSIKDGCGANRVNSDGTKCDCGTDPCGCLTVDGVVKAEKQTLLQRIASALEPLFRTGKELSDEDRRMALGAAFDAREEFAMIVAVYSDSVVYATFDGLFQRAYEIADDGTVSLGDEVTRVRPETDFVPVKTNEENDMDKEEKVKALIANEGTHFTEDDTEFLMGLEESQLDKLEPKAAENQPEPTPDPEPEPTSNEPVSVDQYIANAPPEIASVLQESIRTQEEKRNGLISSIKANKANQFTDEELRSFQTPQLEKLARVATPADYSGRGAPRTAAAPAEDPNAPPEPIKVFDDNFHISPEQRASNQ